MADTLSGCFGSKAAAEGCLTYLMTRPGWLAYFAGVLAFVVANSIIGYSIAWLLDFWWIPLCVRRGWATRSSNRRIKLSTAEVVGWNFVGINSSTIWPSVAGLTYVRAVGSVTLSVYPWRMVWALVAFHLWYDTWYHWSHRMVHRVKPLYRLIHADHHMISAMMEARGTLVFNTIEGLLVAGFPNFVYLAVYLWIYRDADLLMILMPLLVGSHISILQHVGVDFHNMWAYFATNPLLVPLFASGTMQTPYDHQLHHELPNKNFALIYRHWDDWMGTAAPHKGRMLPASPLLMAYNLAFFAAASWMLQQLPSLSATALLQISAALLVLAVYPLPTPARWLRRAGFLDVLRKAYGSSTEVSAPLKPNQRYIFCYHSQAAVPPGFWWTFAAQDSASPVAAAGIRVRAAVNSTLLHIPIVRQVVALFGGISASEQSIHSVLTAKVTAECVAVCVRSTGEAEMAALVQLSKQTGAALVPVVASGEEGVSSNLLGSLLLPASRRNNKVLVGSPLAPGSDAADYMATLQQLQQQQQSAVVQGVTGKKRAD